MIGDRALFQIIENVGSSIHAPGLQRAAFFSKVVKRNVFEGNIVEIEITAKVQVNFDEFRKPATENSSAGQLLRQPLQRTQRSKGRMLRVINKIAPVPMLDRPATGKDGWHTG